MEEPLDLSACGCPPSSKNPPKKHYQEIGAEAIGNQLVIRVEKDRNRSKKLSAWDPPCDCLIPEIIRPSKNEGPRIINVSENNQIVFRIGSKTRVSSDDPDFRAEPLSYQLGEVDPAVITVFPQLEGSGTQEIERDHVTVGNKNVFMMRIKKKPDAKETKKRNIELEVQYQKIPPRVPTPPLPPFVPPPEIVQSVEEVKILRNAGKKDKKGKKKK